MQSIEVNFNKKLYKLTSIKKTIEVFNGWADFCFEKKDDYYFVSISNPKEYSPEIIKDEFCNYVLRSMKAS